MIIPEDILSWLTKSENYKSSLKEFMETPLVDDDAIMLDEDVLCENATWEILSEKYLWLYLFYDKYEACLSLLAEKRSLVLR